MKKLIERFGNYLKKRFKRFDGSTFECITDENGTVYVCPVCSTMHDHRVIICERCLYPVPFVGGSKPRP